MQPITGTFTGDAVIHGGVPVGDQENHQMLLAQVQGTQTSPDPDWNGATITYSALIDLVAGAGTQRGYFVNVHPAGGRDWGTFQGAITTVGDELRCDGTWRITGGSGRFEGIVGDGTFSMRMPTPETVETVWKGVYTGPVTAG